MGPVRMLQLLRALGEPATILASRFGQVAAVVGSARATAILAADVAREARVEATLAWLAAAPDRHLLTLDDPAYPEAWLSLADAPPCVMVEGRLEALAGPALAIVGSRHASTAGSRSARAFAAGLAQEGWTIASGLALGIDAAAHEGALEAAGTTVAFVGTGLDRVYPARHRALAGRIREAGAIVSEFPLGTPARPGNFPRRNRLIAAHARGVLVVEAARHSGSLITARCAAELGREVFAMPGSIHSPLARGCHWLLRQGARLVEELSDVRDEFPVAIRPQPCPVASPPVQASLPGIAPDTGAGAVLAALEWHPAGVDELAQRLPLGIGAILAALGELVLAGHVEQLGDGRYQRCGTGPHARTRPG